MCIQNWLCAALVALPSAVSAAEPAAINAYEQERDRIEHAAQLLSLEPLFERVTQAQDAIMHIEGMCDEAYLETLTPDALKVDVAPRLKILKVQEPPKRSAGKLVKSVQELVEKLKNEAKVI